MARIAESSKEDIRQRLDIVEVVREYLPGLKRAGRHHKACCPFHQEKTPSFMVNPEKQIFHCFGCQAGGDVFAFVMRMEGLSFPEAVEKLAERAGVKIQQERRELTPEQKERAALREALEFAREHYHQLLMKLPEAEAARRYLAGRGLDRPTIERFRLGYATRGGSLLAAAAKKGFGPETLLKCGLAAERQGRTREYFFSRVLFPILDARGETVGFGGRVMGDGEPKYLNSPETPVFSKGRVLYGLFEALPAIRKERHALLLEGYMDVLAAQQFGVANACAPLGTALTEDHVAKLKTYVDRFTLVFDPDAAGVKAAVRGAEMILAQGKAVAVATLPGGLDPDELLHQKGRAAFDAALAAAEDLPAFKTRCLIRETGGAKTPEAKARVASQVLETIAACPDEILKSEWVRRLAQALDLPEEALYRQLTKGVPAALPPRRRAPSGAGAAKPLPTLERDILYYLFKEPALAAGDGLVVESDLGDARARRILAGLRQALASGREWFPALLEALDDEAAALAREIQCADLPGEDPAGILGGVVGRLRKQRRLREIEPLVLRRDPSAGPPDPELHREYIRLLTELKGTKKEH